MASERLSKPAPPHNPLKAWGICGCVECSRKVLETRCPHTFSPGGGAATIAAIVGSTPPSPPPSSRLPKIGSGSMASERTPRTEDDPIIGDGGYPHESELQRIRDWPWEGDFRPLMEYIHRRWRNADVGYWKQEGDRFAISTSGWSGNEDIIGALEQTRMFRMLCPVSWRRGVHYVYDVQRWSDDEPGKHQLIRDPDTPLVFGTGSAWPDLLVAGTMASLGISGGITIVRQALSELSARAPSPTKLSGGQLSARGSSNG